MILELCHCGQPLHYSDENNKDKVKELIKQFGTHIDVTCDDVTYRVPRHYIALHGIKGSELNKFGFEILDKNTDDNEAVE